MDPQNQGSRSESPSSGPAYPPPMYAQQAQPVAGGQPDLVKRGIAAFIDFAVISVLYFVVVMVLGIALGGLGALVAGLVAFAAVLARDVALQGRSLGKKIMGLNVANASGGAITVEQSARRNITLSLGYLSMAARVLPIVGWPLYALLSLAGFGLGCYELYLVATGKPRLGDQIAGTHVVVEGQAAIAL